MATNAKTARRARQNNGESELMVHLMKLGIVIDWRLVELGRRRKPNLKLSKLSMAMLVAGNTCE